MCTGEDWDESHGGNRGVGNQLQPAVEKMETHQIRPVASAGSPHMLSQLLSSDAYYYTHLPHVYTYRTTTHKYMYVPYYYIPHVSTHYTYMYILHTFSINTTCKPTYIKDVHAYD